MQYCFLSANKYSFNVTYDKIDCWHAINNYLL